MQSPSVQRTESNHKHENRLLTQNEMAAKLGHLLGEHLHREHTEASKCNGESLIGPEADSETKDK